MVFVAKTGPLWPGNFLARDLQHEKFQVYLYGLGIPTRVKREKLVLYNEESVAMHGKP